MIEPLTLNFNWIIADILGVRKFKNFTVFKVLFYFTQENTLDIVVENHGRVNYVHQGYNKFNEERKGEMLLVIYPTKVEREVLKTEGQARRSFQLLLRDLANVNE